MDIEKIGTP